MTVQKNAVEKPLAKSWSLYGIAVVTVLLTVWYTLKPMEAQPASVIEGLSFVALSGLCIPLFGMLARQFNFMSTEPGQIMLALTVGFVLWCIAEATWVVLILMDQITVPSISDVFWVGGYLPQIFALLMNTRAIRIKFRPGVLVLWIALSILTVAAVILLDVAPLLMATPDFGTLVTIAYPLLDTIVIVLALVIVLKFKAGQVAKPWAALILGFILTAVGDIWYLYADTMGQYAEAFNPVDYFLSLGYVVYILSGFLFIRLYRTQRVSS